MVRRERGLSLIIFVFMIFVTGVVIVASISFLIVHETVSAGIGLNREKALYIAETGIGRAMEYLEDDTDWSDNNGSGVISESFGDGSYSIDLSSGTLTTIIVDSVATVDSSPRQVTRTIRQKIRRLPEAFNYAIFSGSTNSIQVKGTVEVNGGDVYAKGDITGGTLDVPDGGSVSTSGGGFVYSEGSVTASGTYSIGITPNHTLAMPVLDTTYYDNIMTGYDSDINTYDTEANYLGYTGQWESDPNGIVNIVLSGNRYFSDFTAKGSSSITGSGAIICDGDVKLQDDTTVTPSGGTILIIARDNLRVIDRASVSSNTILYSKDNTLRVIDRASVEAATLLSATDLRALDRATVSNSTFYQSVLTDYIRIDGSNVRVSGCNLISRAGIRVLDGAQVDSDSLLYVASTADEIRISGNNTRVDGSILSNSKIKLINNAHITGIVYTQEADLNKGTINGSIVAGSMTDDKLGSAGDRVTINYDSSYFPEAPPGLGLDIDGDVNEEGVIVKVPGTWQEI